MATASDHPRLRQTVLDTPDPRLLADFYRELLGYRYRPGDAPTDDDEDPDWLVLLDDAGAPRLAFQLAPDMPTPAWPTGTPPQMLHLDLVVDDVDALRRHRARAEELGARMLEDRSDDADEPLVVLADPSGHPFCVFVAAAG
jgi:catechol 2,3-dioxygenase-like lactoylglutathione lyase family enzyme